MPRIVLKNVSLDFPVYGMSVKKIQRRVVDRIVGTNLEVGDNRIVVPALQDISFSFSTGDRVAIIGRNGSGKSSLLRLLAGVYTPQFGEIEIDGRVSALFTTALGLNHEISGMENIKCIGMLLGMSAAYLKERLPHICEFTELGDYLDMPVRTYSAGMKMRMQFAVATEINPDILLLDEVIGAGDNEFRRKAFARIKDLSNSSGMVFIALHNIPVLRQLCNKAIWMHHGTARAIGDFEEVIAQRNAWELEQQQKELSLLN